MHACAYAYARRESNAETSWRSSLFNTVIEVTNMLDPQYDWFLITVIKVLFSFGDDGLFGRPIYQNAYDSELNFLFLVVQVLVYRSTK